MFRKIDSDCHIVAARTAGGGTTVPIEGMSSSTAHNKCTCSPLKPKAKEKIKIFENNTATIHSCTDAMKL